MKAFVLSAVLLTSTLVSLSAATAEDSEPPLGVAAANWIQISDKLGFVVVKIQRPEKPEPVARLTDQRILQHKTLPPLPAAGYFMVRTIDGWQRLIVMSPAELAAADVG